jgi:hypothetical protein
MPFIGQQPITGAYHKLDSITTSATATYNLQLNGGAYSPTSANHLLVSLNGVMQAPQDSFTVSGSQITFASALTSSDSIDFIMALGDVLDIGVPSDGTVNTSQLANDAVTTAKITDANITDAKLASTLDLSGKTVTYGLTSSDIPAGTVVQYQLSKITGTQSWTHTAFDQWRHVLEITLTPKLTSSTLYARAVIGGYENSNTSGRGHMKIIVGTSAYGNSFGHNYGGTPTGTVIGEQMVAQDSTSTSGTISTETLGTISNTDGSAKYFLFTAAQQDNTAGTMYINRWNNNQSYLEVWEVA